MTTEEQAEFDHADQVAELLDPMWSKDGENDEVITTQESNADIQCLMCAFCERLTAGNCADCTMSTCRRA